MFFGPLDSVGERGQLIDQRLRTETANQSSEDVIVITAEVQLRRAGADVRFVGISDDVSGRPRQIPSLVRAIARARDWVDRILKGEVSGQSEIAAELGLHKRYISRIISLAFLAPDITEAILEGRQPADLSLTKCPANLPMIWSEQREKLGFLSARP